MNNKYKKLAKNTSIFALGTFGSKLLVFLIIPLYTHILTTDDYGKIDLFTSTISLMLPFTTLLIYEAAIRFLIGKEYDEKIIFNNCILVFIWGVLLSLIVSPCLYIFNMGEFAFIFFFLLVLSNYYTVFGQYLKASGNNIAFTISGIINTSSTVFLNLLFLLVFKLGVVGYFYSLMLSYFISGIYIFLKCNTLKLLNFKSADIKSLKEMLKYSMPLVPNNLMWWIMNAGDKYVINFYLGDSANGIFSLAYKIPTILTMLFSIFMQAWQVSAIEERADKKRNDFFKKIFDLLSLILIIITLFIIIGIEPLFNLIIGNDFITSYKYVPLLCVATLVNCYATFAGVVYIITKDSKKSFNTTFFGAITNLFFNFILVSKIGLYGVAVATILGYFTVMILRFNDSKKYLNISYYSSKLFISLVVVLIVSILNIFLSGIFELISSIISMIIIIYLYFIYIKEIFTYLKKLFRKKA